MSGLVIVRYENCTASRSSGTAVVCCSVHPWQPWSREEVLVVKAKLWRMLSTDQAEEMVREGTPASPGSDTDIYDTAKGFFLQLLPRQSGKVSMTV